MTISSPCGFFEKNPDVNENTSIFFSKKYCTAFSLQQGRALSFFSFFLLKSFPSNLVSKGKGLPIENSLSFYAIIQSRFLPITPDNQYDDMKFTA